MTGYGRAEGLTSIGNIKVEVRSLNHRFLEVNLRLPRIFFPFELKVRDLVREHCSRGKVDLTLRLDRTDKKLPVRIGVDWGMLNSYVALLWEAKAKLQLEGEPSLDHLVHSGLLAIEEEEVEEGIWEEIANVVRLALRELVESREKEGQRILEDILRRIEEMEKVLEVIEAEAPKVPETYRKKLWERVKALLQGVEVDRERLEQEVVYLAERADITEEVVRLKSHIEAFKERLSQGSPVGRSLEFLLQEINREANTIASKSPNLSIIQGALRIKEVAEKLREQVQNVE